MRTTLVTSRANPRVKQLRAAFGGNAKLSGGLVAIEGEHLLQEAMRSGLVFKTIFLSERRNGPEWIPGNVERIELSEEVFASAVDTRSPQGVAALLVPPVWSMGDACPPSVAGGKAPLLLIAAGVQDPGNLGTLIRSAEAFGATGVLTTAGTVDEWNQKALKARGVRMFAAVAAESESNSVAACAGGVAVSAADVDLAGACALMIGNEGAGLGAELLALADARVSIPMPGRVESLNAAVAGSLLLYEAARQRAG
jgi:TrmH family RNA methyltransferase